jgi:hypothetical protein
MTEANDKYAVLQDKLVEQRDSGNTLLTEDEEDKLLDEMDPLWYEMTDDERGFHNILASEWAKNRENKDTEEMQRRRRDVLMQSRQNLKDYKENNGKLK